MINLDGMQVHPTKDCHVQSNVIPDSRVSEDDFRSSDSQNDFSQVTLMITSPQMSLTTTSVQGIQHDFT